MAGHSKWAGIKHKKAVIDAKRGKLFTKLGREITVAAKIGGGDLNANPRLRTAVTKARGYSMPNDNIDRAIKKGTGDLEGVTYEEISYEGYGPGGIAIMLEVMTDNRNRTVSEIRSIFSKAGGQMGENGCVSWMFDRRGLVVIPKEGVSEEELMEAALEAGAEDFINAVNDEAYEIITPVDDLEPVQEVLAGKNYEIRSAEITMIPQNSVDVTESDQAKKIVRLMDNLEDQDDVQNVYANFDIPENILAELEG